MFPEHTRRDTAHLVRMLMAEDAAGRLRYRGVDRDGRYVVYAAGGRPRVYDPPGMWAYLHGRHLGAAGPVGPGELPAWRAVLAADEAVDLATGPRPLVAVAGLGKLAGRRVGAGTLIRAEYADACRTQIRYAADAAGLGAMDLAEAAGRNRQGVRRALRWGTGPTLTVALAERLVAAAGCEWRVLSVPRGRRDRVGRWIVVALPPGEVALPEPAGLYRMRRLADASGRGRLEVIRPTDPNEAYRARLFHLRTGGGETRVHVDVLAPLLTGLADGART